MKVRLTLTDPDRVVPDPLTGKPVPANGVDVKVPLSKYWKRRLRDGDVIEAEKVSRAPASIFDDSE